jgi:hypothetical protein
MNNYSFLDERVDEAIEFYRGYLEEAKRHHIPEEQTEGLQQFLDWFVPLRKSRDQFMAELEE